MINRKNLGMGLCAGLALALPHGTGRAQQAQAVQAVPARIQAESYDSYYDASPGNAGGAYRQDDVDIEPTADIGGGFNVGWVDAGEHLDYTISVPSSGAYDFTARIATPYSGRTLAFVIDGVHQGSLPLAQTGTYQTWANATQTIDLSAGQHHLRVLFETELINLNYIDVSATGGDPPPPPPGDTGDIVPIYGPSTPREPALSETLPNGNLLTRVGGRVRDRHAREEQFQAYQHYLPLYFQDRTFGLEIIDPTPVGGSEITFNMHTAHPHDGTNFRIFFRGINTVAEYHLNTTFQRIDDYNYTQRISYNPVAGRSIQPGDLMEIEVGVFLRQPVEGRFNYYSRAWLYRAGQPGLIAWEGTGPRRDSVPLASGSLLGGDTTQSINESDEPERYLMQMALNIAPANAQPFVEGRRLHHTRFTDGVHSEPGNPVFSAHINKAGPLYNQSSCIGCHAGNGRSQPPESTNTAIHDMVFKVGTPAGGSFVPHAQYGRQLQTRANSGATAEAEVVVASYQTSTVQATDGTVFTLQRPVFDLRAGGDVGFFSARTAPPLVGLGLLDAVHESTILALADANDANGDGISGRASVVTDIQTGQIRLGRFGWKAERASLRQQIASALAEDMGVSTTVLPGPNNQVELGDADLSRMEKYVALLAVAPQRFAGDPAVQAGASIFNSVGCNACHVPSLTTSGFHPMAELRDQQIRPYTDLLLHDMGDGLASTLPGEGATTREWRTAPLWNIGLASDVAGKNARYLHDGRARTLMEAILWHGGEAEAAKQRVLQLSATDRSRLVTFLQSL